ncbi:5-dehydro-4-deoxy-D-glucuronate isomerase [Halosquirtibacter laminarini]|uniref:5-dehydro-4-deoxy-D-glucuronate isomerase n=1 Tax=Halosquirtibacter laminarini TaxID=3374600 RepID=A0AC61NG89_9BACT|nr:5-dehydro-4-deoxy-D-glucuronate isomerase [Prolixibacteraceae bacterium]
MAENYREVFATHPRDAKNYDTQRLRDEFLVETVMNEDRLFWNYSHYDRLMVGGVVPVNKEIVLEAIEPLKSENFLDRRELGVVNVGSKGVVLVDGTAYELDYKEAIYVGMGCKEIIFKSCDSANPAHFYMNSAPAHIAYPTVKVSREDAIVIELGEAESSNRRTLNKLIVNDTIQTNQLQMGMTELHPGSVWNTMPAHTHSRRMEAYFYFEVPQGHSICHLMGEPQETRHVWMQNEQAIFSPTWSIHSAAGTSNYTFIWGMGGENLAYGDMDVIATPDLR